MKKKNILVSILAIIGALSILLVLVWGGIRFYKLKIENKSDLNTGDKNSEIKDFSKEQDSTTLNTEDIKSAVQAAANSSQYKTGTSIHYFKIVGDKAYILLDMDVDGWAGVSYAIEAVHPLVEAKLLEYPEIRQVFFSPAPGDKVSI